MYINDVPIFYYAIFAIIGLFVGQIVDWTNKRLPEYKKVISLDIIKEYKLEFKPNYILMILTSIIYVFLVYFYGIHNSVIENLDLIKFLIVTPMLLSVFVIDYKYQIIPNRLNLTLLEVGIGEIPPEEIELILKAKDRQKAGKTLPAHGLYLMNVDYE